VLSRATLWKESLLEWYPAISGNPSVSPVMKSARVAGPSSEANVGRQA
jgi:hypothetical protein